MASFWAALVFCSYHVQYHFVQSIINTLFHFWISLCLPSARDRRRKTYHSKVSHVLRSQGMHIKTQQERYVWPISKHERSILIPEWTPGTDTCDGLTTDHIPETMTRATRDSKRPGHCIQYFLSPSPRRLSHGFSECEYSTHHSFSARECWRVAGGH